MLAGGRGAGVKEEDALEPVHGLDATSSLTTWVSMLVEEVGAEVVGI